MWDILSSWILRDNSPWVVIGDFNAILATFEKHGGHTSGRRCPFLVILWIMPVYFIWVFEVLHSRDIEVHYLKDMIELLVMKFGFRP